MWTKLALLAVLTILLCECRYIEERPWPKTSSEETQASRQSWGSSPMNVEEGSPKTYNYEMNYHGDMKPYRRVGLMTSQEKRDSSGSFEMTKVIEQRRDHSTENMGRGRKAENKVVLRIHRKPKESNESQENVNTIYKAQ